MPARFIARFRSWPLFLALSLLALAALAAEPREVGRVLVASGEVTAEREGASARSLGRGDRLYEGDAITTGPGARAQLRLSDEGLVQLDADTEYRIQRYRAEGEERGAVTELVEGGLRTVTGAIGDDDPDNYQLDTPVATIGIRGTHFALNHSEDSGTVGEVAQGTIVVENDGGSSEVGAGSFFAVRSRDSAPERLDQRPAALDFDDGPDEGEDEAGEGEESEGQEGEDQGQEDEGEGQQGDDEGAAGDDGTGSDEADNDKAGGNEAGNEDVGGAGDGGAFPGGDQDGSDNGLTDEASETDDDGFLNESGDAVYSPGEDEGSREEAEDQAEEENEEEPVEEEPVEEEPVEEEPVEEEPTPWYEDESLTQFGVTVPPGGPSQPLVDGPSQPPGVVVDGEEHPETGTVQTLSLGEDGALVEMVYSRPLRDGEEIYGDEEVRMAAVDGRELADSGSADALGIHWGRWNLGDYTQEVDEQLVIGEDAEAPHGTDWHWLVLEDADDLMMPDQYAALSGTASFAWAGGTEIRATDGVAEYTYQVDKFSLTADFDSGSFTDGELALVDVGGNGPRESIVLNGVDPEMQSMGASFFLMLRNDQFDRGQVTGQFIGEEADGATVTFTIMDGNEEIQGLEGVGALERQ